MIHWSIILCLTLAALVYSQHCQPPDPHGYCINSQGVDNCAPEDRRITSPTDQCHTSFRFRADHILPPEWELMFDSYDYESLVRPVFLGREFDGDGDVGRDEWEDRGGVCQRGLRVCAHTLGSQDNWVFSPHIKYPPGSTTVGGGLPTEIYLDVSFRFTQCNGACVNNFADLFRYDTNSIASESDRTDKRHYVENPFFGTGTASRLDQTGHRGTVSDTRTLTIASPSSSRTNGFHFGIRDSGNCGQINRIYFYYTPCKERQDGLVNYPELVRAPNGSPPNEGMACCAPNSHPTTSLTFKAHSATDGTTGDERCERNVRCECDAGYRLIMNADGTHRCEECPSGTYRSLTDDQGTCLDCPMNTAMDVKGAEICSCLDEFFRDEQNNEGPGVKCTTPPGPVTDLKTTANTSTSVTLEWTRPEVTGRDDFYYTYQIFDPDQILPDTPRRLSFTASSPKITYTEDRLRPVTPFTFRITTHNGVSDEDKENAALRKVELVIKTREGVPSAPRNVSVFTEVVVWGPPQNPNGIITGYEVKFSGSLSGSVSVNKEASESYHIISDTDLSRLQGTIQVQVRAKTRAGFGDYSSPQSVTLGRIKSVLPPPPPPCPCTPDPPVKFLLNGKIYTDGDTVLIPDIGEGDDGLLCVTEYENCCSNSVARFYFPDGNVVGFSSRSSLYQNRGEQLVRLNKRDGSLSPTGRYRCDIPDDKGVTQSIFINIINPDPICPPPPPPPIGTCPPPVQCPTVPTPDNCLSLSSPTNGRVSASSTAVGSTATYSCNQGYSLVGASTRSCESQGSAWSGNTPSCQVRECPNLTSPTNGRVLVSSRSSGGIATYICNPGYTPSGSSRRTCLSNGQWSGSVAICRPESQACPVLTNPVNGNVAILGSIATYTCNPGYTRVGSNARLCQSQSRTWTGTAPTCVRPCPTLPPPLNGRVSVSGDRTATYTCSTGYTLSGSSTRTCQTNGAWSGTTPTCVQCPLLFQPSGGTVTITSRAPGGIAFYTCNTGNNLIGLSRRSCQTDGAWSGSAPTCQAPQCSPLPPPLNGRVSASGGTATYTCSTGYTLSGSSTRICQTNGAWSGTAPTCGGVQCPELSRPSGGTVTITTRAPRGIAFYRCNTGNNLVGSVTRSCQTDGTWNGNAPTCQARAPQCPTLPPPLNGRVSASRGTATYTCSTGYTLSGSSTRTCQTNGAWSGTAPTCGGLQCPELSQPSGGTVTIFSRAPGGIAFYRCNTGNNLIGSSFITCQNGGTWSGNAPTCQAPVPQCPTLPPPLNGRVSASGGTATYTCSTGYTLSGSSTRTCQTNGAWSGTAPTCGGVQCSELSQPSGGTVTITSQAPGGIAFYRCNTGNNLVGLSTRTCQTNGAWSGTAPTCRIVQCPELSHPSGGTVTITTRTPRGIAFYRCNTGNNLVGSVTRSCQTDGTWSGNAPTCQAPQCSTLPHPLNGRVSASGGTATYTCSTGYTLSGSSTRTCQTNGAWSGSQPICAMVTGFMLRGEPFTNGSSVSLEDIGETAEALIFPTEIKDCCRMQRIGQCYDPNGVQLSSKGANEMYRNRDSQMVRLNKVDAFTGEAAIPGLYCCTVPNNDGNLHRICANITV